MEYREIPLDKILPDPSQPRKNLGDLASLVESIRAHGVLEPILVAEEGGMYRIVAGERRYQAAKMAGLRAIPALVQRARSPEVSLAENLARKEMDVVETAVGIIRAYATRRGITPEEAREELKKGLNRYSKTRKEDELVQWLRSLGASPDTLALLLRLPFSLSLLEAMAGLGLSARLLRELSEEREALEGLVQKALQAPLVPGVDPIVRARYLLKDFIRKMRGEGAEERKPRRSSSTPQAKASKLLSELLPLLRELGYGGYLPLLERLKEELQAGVLRRASSSR